MKTLKLDQKCKIRKHWNMHFFCRNVKEIPEQVLNHLKIKHLTQLPITASQIVLYDEFSTAKTLINTIWMFLLCLILNNRLNKCPNNAEEIAKKIKGIVVDTNKAYPNRDLARECRKLLLFEFLASLQVNPNTHWTTFETLSKL